MDSRLPAHLEAAAVRRMAESLGGYAMILSKGERDAGTLAIVIIVRGEAARLYERMPQLDGTRRFVPTKYEDIENKHDFSRYLDHRCEQDPDLWLIEAVVADEEQFVAALPG